MGGLTGVSGGPLSPPKPPIPLINKDERLKQIYALIVNIIGNININRREVVENGYQKGSIT